MKTLIILLTIFSLSATAQTTPAWFTYGDTSLFNNGTQRFTTVRQMQGYLVVTNTGYYWLDGNRNRMAIKYKVYTNPSEIIVSNNKATEDLVNALSDSLEAFRISQLFRTKNLEIVTRQMQDSLIKMIPVPPMYLVPTDSTYKSARLEFHPDWKTN